MDLPLAADLFSTRDAGRISTRASGGLIDANAGNGVSGSGGLRRSAGFLRGKLGFTLIEDSFVPEQNKRWVVVEPPGAAGQGAKLLLARGANPEQVSRIGNQTGGRVFLFLYTDDFWRDYNTYRSLGIEFVREPSEAPYGTVAVFKDLYGTLWDLVQLRYMGTFCYRR